MRRYNNYLLQINEISTLLPHHRTARLSNGLLPAYAL